MEQVKKHGVRLTTAVMLTAMSSLAVAQSHYYYFKEQKPLREYSNEVAVLRETTVTREQITRDLGSRGLNTNGLSRGTISGWWMGQVDVPSLSRGATPATVMRDVVTSAALDPDNLFVSPVFAGADGGTVVVTPSLIVGFDDYVTSAAAEQILQEFCPGAITDRNWSDMPGVYKIKPLSRNAYEVLDMANRLALRPDVRFAEPDMMFTGESKLVPNDPQFNESWGLNNWGQDGGVLDVDMDAVEAWDITQGQAAIKVIVLDNGVDQAHPDINQLPGIDVTFDPTPGGGPGNDCDKHGTPVAGCISAIINNGLGTAGIAPACKVLSARTFVSNTDCSGSWTSYASWTVDSLAWAQSQGVRVSNNSNSYGFQSATIANKYQQTHDAGMIHFASAGNSNVSTIGYPSSLPSVNSVAALNRYGERASFSNYGVGLTFSAPGQSIYSCDRTGPLGYTTGNYVYMSGTSFSSPYAAGIAALLLSVRPALTPAEVESLLQNTATDIGDPGYDTVYGWGALNARAALEELTAAADDWTMYE